MTRSGPVPGVATVTRDMIYHWHDGPVAGSDRAESESSLATTMIAIRGGGPGGLGRL